MSRLLIFNPEHDYALANAGAYYIPPLSIRKLAASLKLIPIVWSMKDDYILTPDNRLISANNLEEHELSPQRLSNISEIIPWGWNAALKHRLTECGITGERLLPSDEAIDRLRNLSHRRISIKLNRLLDSPFIPSEFFCVDEGLEFAASHPGCYFKMPWSSGGRGILATRELNLQQISEWISGCIKKQGSVLAERGVDRAIDFASLWNISAGKVEFEGFSVSLSDGRGKYGGNLYGDPLELENFIKSKVPSFSYDLIERQQSAIQKEISPFYSGKLGIDMIGGNDGRIYPCIELNLRRTMGHVALDYFRLPAQKKSILEKLNLPLKELKCQRSQ